MADDGGCLEGLIQSLDGGAAADIQTVDELPQTLGPLLREMNKVRDQSGAEFLDDEVGCSVRHGLEEPGDDLLEEFPRVILGQIGALPVELDDDGQGGEEFDLVVGAGDQALGELPSLVRLLESLEDLLDGLDGVRSVCW